MKPTLLKTLLFACLTIVFFSCKKDENQVVFQGGTAPALTATTLGNPVLDINAKSQNAITFKWTNPAYKFSTGVSSQDVTYTLQVDTVGANFSSPNLKEVVVQNDLNLSLTVGDFNNLFAAWTENIAHKFEFRIKSTLGNAGAGSVYSNTLGLTVTPYLDVAVVLPFTGDIFLIGNATPGGDATGWNNPVPAPSQQFTKTSSTTYELTIDLFGGKQFLIIPKNGDWSNKYAVTGSAVTWQGGPFGYNASDNFPGPPETGKYKIILNFKTGKFSVTKI